MTLTRMDDLFRLSHELCDWNSLVLVRSGNGKSAGGRDVKLGTVPLLGATPPRPVAADREHEQNAFDPRDVQA